MNKKAQGMMTILYADLVFVILWALGLGGLLKYWGQWGIATYGLTGLEALLLGNLNMVVFIGVILVNIATFTFGGGN